MIKNIALQVNVFSEDTIFGDLMAALEEAYCLSKQLNIPIQVNYANQCKFTIKPDMDVADIEKLKKTKVFIEL